MGFWFLIVLLPFTYQKRKKNCSTSIPLLRWILGIYCDFRIHVMIWGLVGFYLSKPWVFIMFCSTGTFDDLVKNRVSFLICSKNGFIEWFKRFLKQSRTNIRFVWWELQMCVDEHENMLLWFGGCGFLNLRTLSFDLFSLCFLLLKSHKFGTRLKYD